MALSLCLCLFHQDLYGSTQLCISFANVDLGQTFSILVPALPSIQSNSGLSQEAEFVQCLSQEWTTSRGVFIAKQVHTLLSFVVLYRITIIEQLSPLSKRVTYQCELRGAKQVLVEKAHKSLCVRLMHAGCRPVITSTVPLQPTACFPFSHSLCSDGEHHSAAFSRWFPAGRRMTCDNITVWKGQAWREAVGGLGHSLSKLSTQSSAAALTSTCS